VAEKAYRFLTAHFLLSIIIAPNALQKVFDINGWVVLGMSDEEARQHLIPGGIVGSVSVAM
jgi:hypothetical protein